MNDRNERLRQAETEGDLLQGVVDYYHSRLPGNTIALGYLKARRLHSQAALDKFQIGICDRTLGLVLPIMAVSRGKAIRSRLIQLGILKENGHEAYRGSLTIPLTNAQGQLVQLYGRKVGRGFRPGVPMHTWLPGPRGIFNADALESPEWLLADSVLNALTLWALGHHNALWVSQEALEGVQMEGKRIVLAYRDESQAGQVGQVLAQAGARVSRISLPFHMDVNELVVKRGVGAVEVIADLLAQAGTATEPDPVPIQPAGPIPADAEPEPRPGLLQPEGEDYTATLEDRAYRIRGLKKNAMGALKVNLRASRNSLVFIDTVDLSSARARTTFTQNAALELETSQEAIKKDLGQLLLALEARQVEETQQEAQAVNLTDQEQQEALDLLRDPKLMERIGRDFQQAGMIGEENNALVGYLAATSRKLDRPLAVVIQSSSSAGKSTLMDHILGFMPGEDGVKVSALTGQALYYMAQSGLRNKILAIAEVAGAERAKYALKLLQSEGELSIASTGKDSTGRMTTRQYRVDGPVMLLMTTTAVDMDEELQSRCLVLAVSEDRDQTRAIHDRQRQSQTLEGMLETQDRDRTQKLHQNAQRLLRPLLVVNPYAQHLTFSDAKIRMRRDHLKYLTLIRAVTLLHQHQRTIQTVRHKDQEVEYIETTLEDIQMANHLAHQIMGRCIDEELAPQPQRLLQLLFRMVREVCGQEQKTQTQVLFTRKQVRDFTGLSDFAVQLHLDKLTKLEYVLAHRGQRGRQYLYELLWDGTGLDGQPFVMGLLDISNRKHQYDARFEPQKTEFKPGFSPQIASK